MSNEYRITPQIIDDIVSKSNKLHDASDKIGLLICKSIMEDVRELRTRLRFSKHINDTDPLTEEEREALEFFLSIHTKKGAE